MALAEERRALLNVARLLADAACRWPERTALVDLDAAGGRREFTFEALNVTVARMAAALRARGLNRGDRVAMLMTNSWEYVAAFLAITHAGCIAVPLNTRLLAKEHAHMVSDSGARLLLAHADLLTDRESLAHIPELGCVCTDAFDTLLVDDVGEPAPAAREDVASIFYTSGTTGLPKGVMLSHGSWRQVGDYTRRYLRYGDREVTIHCAPLTHGSGFLMLPTLEAGGVTLTCAKFDPARTLAIFARESVTNGFFVPSMIRMLLDALGPGKANAPAMRSLYYAGSPIDPATLVGAVERFGPVVVQSFGQAEAPMFLTVLDHETHRRIAAGELSHLVRSAGLAVDGTTIRIVDDGGCELLCGETGEIVIRGPHLMNGYWNRPEATAETLKDGWLHTGDVGRLDADGYLYIVDRKKDMIISGGSNVYAREVEEVLLALPGVREVAVVGLPDPRWGELVTAVLVSGGGAPIDDATIVEFCRDNLPDYRRPRRFFWIDALPRNAYGKVMKRELRTRFSQS